MYMVGLSKITSFRRKMKKYSVIEKTPFLITHTLTHVPSSPGSFAAGKQLGNPE